MTAQTQPSPLLIRLYGTGWVLPLHLRHQSFEIDFGGRPLPTILLSPGQGIPICMRQKCHYRCPEEIPGALLTRSGLLFDDPSSAQIVKQQPPALIYISGFFQHRGVTRLRRADTQGDKIKH